MLGLIILAQMPEDEGSPSLHLGYLLGQNARGKGYGSELVSGLVDWLPARRLSVTLKGGVATGHAASARVLQNAGFEKAADPSSIDTDMFVKQI